VTTGLFSSLFARGDVEAGDDAWLQAMLDTEGALARAVERAGLAPPGSGEAITAVARSELFENRTLGAAAAASGNPVPALVRDMTRLAKPEYAGAVHQGATSQDIIDTAAMLVARRAIDVILADLSASAASCADRAAEHASTVMSGRTLLQQAVPVTFGLVAAGWLTAVDEARLDLHRIRSDRLAVQFGGAAGTLASLGEDGPRIAALLGEELGLPVPVLPWHTDRRRVIDLAASLTGTCATLGKIARDVTLLAQTEVAEVTPGGGAGGSSAMPHKQNPVAAITVLASTKQAPGLLATLAAAAEQELQRAAGAWHSEWQPLSHLLTLTGSATTWTTEMLTALEIHPQRMRTNLEATQGLPLAEHLANLLTPALGRLQAHDLLAKATTRATIENIPLAAALLSDEKSAAKLADAGLTAADLNSALEPESYLGATAEFINRALSAHAQTDGTVDG
jgi:3-carboxy-cis,cis-muconate cycloisomerase